MTDASSALAKVPAITLGFWLIKILATTLGETGADLFTQQYEDVHVLLEGKESKLGKSKK